MMLLLQDASFIEPEDPDWSLMLERIAADDNVRNLASQLPRLSRAQEKVEQPYDFGDQYLKLNIIPSMKGIDTSSFFFSRDPLADEDNRTAIVVTVTKEVAKGTLLAPPGENWTDADWANFQALEWEEQQRIQVQEWRKYEQLTAGYRLHLSTTGP